MSRFAQPGERVLPEPGDRVLVAGLGRSGIAAARALSRLGVEVVACDDAADEALRAAASDAGASRAHIGAMDVSLLDGVQLVVASPGIRPSTPLLAAARESGTPVWSEVELGWRIATVPVLGVTGTNGKTTTTSMLAAALRASGVNAIAAGNIGLPLCDVAGGDADAIVAELSSFQLHHIVSFRPAVGVLLNIAPDHLDWHGSLQAYASDKSRLFQNQQRGDTAVVHRDCLDAVQTAGRVVFFTPGSPAAGEAGVKDGVIVVPEGRVCETAAMRVRGAAMVADAIAAAAAACAFGADPAAAGRAIEAFQPGEHRMELVETIGGVSFVNDSKATNPHATLAALDGLEHVVLIAGGQNKGLDLSPVAHASGIDAVIAIGEAAGQIEAAFHAAGVAVERAGSMDEAVERAAGRAGPGGTVLLSPACASFDMFADYRARGEAFRAAVKRIASSSRPGGTR